MNKLGQKKLDIIRGSRRGIIIIIVTIINPLAAKVVGATQMILQPFFSLHFPCSPLPSRTCRTPVLSIPWCCLPISSSVCLVFFPLSLCLARWFWPDLMNGKHDHITAVCISLRPSGGLRVGQLPAGSWHGFLVGNTVFVRDSTPPQWNSCKENGTNKLGRETLTLHSRS